MSLRRDGTAVRCGVTDCAAKVGEVAHGQTLALLPGYSRDRHSGAVRMTPRSERRYRDGQYPRSLPGHAAGGRHALRPGPLPVKVKCWRCHWVHDADAAVLGVESPDHDGWIVWNWDDG